MRRLRCGGRAVLQGSFWAPCLRTCRARRRLLQACLAPSALQTAARLQQLEARKAAFALLHALLHVHVCLLSSSLLQQPRHLRVRCSRLQLKPFHLQMAVVLSCRGFCRQPHRSGRPHPKGMELGQSLHKLRHATPRASHGDPCVRLPDVPLQTFLQTPLKSKSTL